MAIPDTPINRLALRKAREEAALLGTFKVIGDLATGVSFEYVGGPQHGERVPYNKLKETLKQSQFRMREVFGADRAQPGSGWYKYPDLNLIAEEWAKEVTRNKKKYGKGAVGTLARDSHGLESQMHATALAKALENGGFPVIDADGASVMRLFHGDKELSYEEVADFLRRRFGLTPGEGSKVDKRMKAFMSMRGIGSAEMITSIKDARRLTDAGRADEIVGRYRVGVFDEGEAIDKMAKLLGHRRGAKDLAVKATEGQSLVKASVLRSQITKMRAEGNALLGAKAGQDLSGMRIRKRGHDMLKQADNLEEMMESGGRIFGSLRMMGLDVVDMKNGKLIPSLQGQIKGDALVIEDDAWDAIPGARGLDVITARWNIKKDLKRTKSRLMTLEKHIAHDVFLDVQSVSSFPQFFPVDRMKQKMLDDFALVTSKETPFEDMQRGLLAMVKEVDDAVEDYGPGNRLFENLDPAQRARAVANLQEAAAYGRDLKESLRLKLPPQERAPQMSAFLTSYRRFLLAEKKGKFFPRMRVPDAKAAGIITDDVERVVREGYVGYSKRAGGGAWVMHGKTFADLYKALGGPDLDDTIVQLLRWDDEIDKASGKAGGLRAVMYRQPNALTEFAILNVDLMDSRVNEVMLDKGVATAKIWTAARDDVRRSRSELRAGRQRLRGMQMQQTYSDTQIATLRQALQTPGSTADQTYALDEINQWQAQKSALFDAAREQELVNTNIQAAEDRATAQMEADLKLHLERLDMKALRKSHSIKKQGNYWVGHDDRVKFYEGEAVGKKEARSWAGIQARLKNWANSSKDLGQYSNYKMVLDAQINSLGKKLGTAELAAVKAAAEGTGVDYFEELWTIRHEPSVDAARETQAGIKVRVTKGMPDIGVPWEEKGVVDPRFRRIKLVEFQQQSIREILTNMALKRKADIASPGIDPYMLSERFRASGSDEMAKSIYAELQTKLGLTGTLDDMLHMARDDKLAVMAQMEQAFIDNVAAQYGEEMVDPDTGRLLIDPDTGKVQETALGGKAKQFLDDLVQPESLRSYGKGYESGALDLLNEFSDARKRHTYNAAGVDKSMAGVFDKADKVDWEAAEADVLDRLRPYMDVDASGREFVGSNIDQRVAALLVESKRSGRYGLLSVPGSGDVSISLLARRAEVAARLDSGVMTDAAGNEVAIPEETRALWQEELDKKIWATDWDATSDAKRGALDLGRKAAERARVAAAAADTTTKAIPPTKLEKITAAALKGLDSTSGRWVGAGVGLLAAMGVLRTARGDRTPEDMAGPPNLPGGNPYMGPMGGGYSFDSSMEGGQEGGVTYDVRARGGDPQALARAASFIVGPDSMGGSYSQSRSLESPDTQRERLMAQFN